MNQIKEGDTARVTADGKFHGQEVKVLAVKVKTFRRNQKTTYRLATMWDEIYYPTMWDENEIEHVETEINRP